MESLGPLVGRGYVAEVFAYGEGKVVKLFIDEGSDDDAELEARVTRAARESGLSAPRMWEVVNVNGRPGIVMERIEAESMHKWARLYPWRRYTGPKIMAQIHADMHSKTSAEMPDLREKLRSGVENADEVSDEIRSLALERLARLPDGNSICHGDLHLNNVLMSKAGPVIVDWKYGSRGHPAADVARAVMVVSAGMPMVGVIRRTFVRVSRKIFLSIYLKEYFRITGMTWEEVSPWLLPASVKHANLVLPEDLDEHLDYVQRLV